jgi:hypothetical protein
MRALNYQQRLLAQAPQDKVQQSRKKNRSQPHGYALDKCDPDLLLNVQWSHIDPPGETKHQDSQKTEVKKYISLF